MADDNEVLIKVEVDNAVAVDELNQTEQAIQGITGAIDDLDDQIKQGTISQDQYTNAKKRLEAELGKEQAAHKNLSDAIKKGSESTKEGTKHIDELAVATKKTKGASAEAATGIDQYAGALDQFGVGAGGAIKQVQGLTKASLTFLATPIGAIIGAIVAVLGTLAAYFRNTGDGADKFAKIMAQLGAVFDVLIDRVSAFGRGVYNIITGNFKEGFDQIKNSVSGVADEMKREAEAAGEVADALDELEDAEKDYEVQASKTRNEIKLLVLQSKDRTKTELERAALLDKALQKEIQQNKNLIAIREGQLKATVAEAERRANTARKDGESLKEYAIRITQIGELSDEVRDSVREGIRKLQEAEGESLESQEKIQDKRNKLLDDDLRKKERIADDYNKTLQDNYKKELELQKEQLKKKEDADKDAAEKKKQRDEDFAKQTAITAIGLQKNVETATKESEEAISGFRKYNSDYRKLINSEEYKEVTDAILLTAQLAQEVTTGITRIRQEELQQQLNNLELQTRAELLLLDAYYEDQLKALDEQTAKEEDTLKAKYERDVAALEAAQLNERELLKQKYENGLITREQYDKQLYDLDIKQAKDKAALEKLLDEALLELDKDHKDKEAALLKEQKEKEDRIKQQAAYEEDQLKKAAFEQNKKIQIAEAVINGIQAAIKALATLGPIAGPIAAGIQAIFVAKQIDLIKSQQYVGSGAQPPPPISSSNLTVPSTNLGNTVDGGIVAGNTTQATNDRLNTPTPSVTATVSVVEINRAQDTLAAKVQVAETV